MRALLTPFFAFILSLPAYAQEMRCDVALKALKTASRIRGLEIKKEVPCLVHDKKQVEKYLLGIIDEQLPPEKLKYEEVAYKKIGLLPQDFDYKNGIVQLYLSQIGGYYDPKKNHFVMAGWLPATLQKGIAAHELTHALQDQYYDLKSFIDPSKQSADTVLAHSALVEGDATAVMYDFDRHNAGHPPLRDKANINDLLYTNIAVSGGISGDVPRSLQMILLFPYTAGFNFVHNIIREKGYQGLAAVYERPPDTTEEIIHIEKYLSGSKDYQEIESDVLKSEELEGYDLVYDDSIGEFGITALLSMFELSQSEIRNAAAGWAGDRLGLLVKGPDQVLLWETRWDSLKDRVEFEELYKKAASKRFPKLQFKGSENALTLIFK